MDKYTKHARVYPTILGAIIPCTITIIMFWDYVPDIFNFLSPIFAYLVYLGLNTIVFSALGYFASELARDISKVVFQFLLFKENETNMPTTKLLLWQENKISESQHKAITQKVENDFGLKLFSKAKEQANLEQAKLVIVDAVRQMREVTRDNKILLQYNYTYGFVRNYMGASVLAIGYILVMWIVNIWLETIPWWFFLIAIAAQLAVMCILYVKLEINANAYARELLSAYSTTIVRK